MAGLLNGKVAIITGAGGGIGRAIAIAMAQEGAAVVVNDLGCAGDGKGDSSAPADKVVDEIKGQGGRAVASYDTVASPEGGERIIKAALESFDRLDILVNNAGILRDRMIFNMSLEEWDAVIKTHLYGHFHCSKPACVLFNQQKAGRIINISSRAAFGNMGQANYSAAKAGILGFTWAIAKDMAKYGVTCNAIVPRAITRLMSPQMQAAWDKAKETGAPILPGMEELKSSLPEDIAPFAVYLATDAAAGVNGEVFLIIGGTISLYSAPQPVRTIYKESGWSVAELLKVVPLGLLPK